jgi:hypothetical protein
VTKKIAAGFTFALILIGLFYWRPHKKEAVPVSDFALLDHTGEKRQLYLLHSKKAVVLIAHKNGGLQPLAGELRDLKQRFAGQGIEFLMINPNLGDKREAVEIDAKTLDLGIPILFDRSQYPSILLGLKHVGETVVILTKDWSIGFRGEPDEKLSQYLDQVVMDRAPKSVELPLRGEHILIQPVERVSYEEHIAPIVNSRCVRCHSGSSSPRLNSYEDLKANLDKIRNTVLTGKMPPINVDPRFASYSDERVLTARNQRHLFEWIDGGAKKDSSDDPIKAFKVVRRRLPLGEKLHSAKMATPHVIAPDGDAESQYYQIGGPVPADLWVTAAVVRPTNPEQLDSVNLIAVQKPLEYFVAKAKQTEFTDLCYDSKLYLAGAFSRFDSSEASKMRLHIWSRGRPQPYYVNAEEPRAAFYIPKGRYLIVEMGHHGSGQAATNEIEVELYGSKDKKDRIRLHSRLLASHSIPIPTDTDRFYAKTKKMKFDKDLAITSMSVHMHLRGKSLKVIATDPQGKEHPVEALTDFLEASAVYSYLTPQPSLKLPANWSIHGVCEYDNSLRHPKNPQPRTKPKFGFIKSDTEMCHLRLWYYFTGKPQ